MEHIPYESYDTTDPESMSDLIEALQKQAKVVMTEADIKAKVKGTKPEYWFYERLSDGSGGPQMAISIAEDGAGNVFLYSVNDDTVHVVPMGETFSRMSHDEAMTFATIVDHVASRTLDAIERNWAYEGHPRVFDPALVYEAEIFCPPMTTTTRYKSIDSIGEHIAVITKVYFKE